MAILYYFHFPSVPNFAKAKAYQVVALTNHILKQKEARQL